MAWRAIALAVLSGLASGSAHAQDNGPTDDELIARLEAALPAPSRAQRVLAELRRAEAAASSATRVSALRAALSAEARIRDAARPAELPTRAAMLERLAAAHVTAQDMRAAVRAIRDAQKAWEEIYGQPDDDGAPAPLAAAYARLADLAERAGEDAYAGRLRTLGARTKSLAVRRVGDGAAYSLVTVFYATSRTTKNRRGDARFRASDFTGDRVADDAPLAYGRLQVSVPHGLGAGKVRTPLVGRPDPKRHIIITDIEPSQNATGFFASIRRFMDDNRSATQARRLREAVVYVHGYANTFETAARRAAKLAYDLRVEGAPILYSWASRGDVASYVVDRFRCDARAKELFAGFLDRVVRETGAERVHVIAHSMGNCLVVRALDELASGRAGDSDVWRGAQARTAPPLDQVVLAAPDLTRGEFTPEVASGLTSVARGVTVYASDQDLALKAAALVSSAVRVGQVRPLLELDGIDVVDATEAPSDVFNHLHFAKGALDDLRALLWAGSRTPGRCVLDHDVRPARFEEGRCEPIDMRAAAFEIRQYGGQRTVDFYCDPFEIGPPPFGTRDGVCANAQKLKQNAWPLP